MRMIKAELDLTRNNLDPYALQIIVDKLPDTSNIVFTQKDNYYFGHNRQGIAKHFYYPGPGEGSCGKKFPIQVREGRKTTKRVLTGPYSSRPGKINGIGGGPYMEVMLVRQKDSKKMPVSIQLSRIKPVLEKSKLKVKEHKLNGEIIYTV